MDPANPAGRENFDSRAIGDPERRRNSCAAGPLPRHRKRKVPFANLFGARIVRQQTKLFVGQTCAELAVDDGDGRRVCASVSDDTFQTRRRLEVQRSWQTMRDYG
jgi:hypothetical protein